MRLDDVEDGESDDNPDEEWSERDELQSDINDWLGLDPALADEATAQEREWNAVLNVFFILVFTGAWLFPGVLLACFIALAARQHPVARAALSRRRSIEGSAELRPRDGRDDQLELVIGGESFRVPKEGSENLDISRIWRVTWLLPTRRIVALGPVRRQVPAHAVKERREGERGPARANTRVAEVAPPRPETPLRQWLLKAGAIYAAINLVMFFAPLISWQTQAYLVVPRLPLPNVGINVDSFFTTPDGRLFIVGGMYRGLMEYDREGRHIRTHRDPTSSSGWAVSEDGRIFSYMTSREPRSSGVAEFDSHLSLIARHYPPRDGVPALAADGSVTFVPYDPGGDNYGPSRPIRPGEKLFPLEGRKESFACDDGGSIERVLLGLRRHEPDGSSRRVGPGWWVAFFTPPFGSVIAYVVAMVVGIVVTRRRAT